MNEALVISSIASWIVIVALAAAVYALARQIGVLHERIRPAGALALENTMSTGDTAPQRSVQDMNGRMIQIGGESEDRRTTLLFFLSPTCPVCKTLLPVLKSLQRKEKNELRIILASDGDPQEHRSFIILHKLQDFLYVISTELGLAFRIGKLPYAVLISNTGEIAAHGLINNREHIESLFELMDNKTIAHDHKGYQNGE